MEKQLRKLNAEREALGKKQKLLLNNQTNMADDEFRKQLYETNKKMIGLIGKILDYHQRRKTECAYGVPMKYYNELFSDPIVKEKFSVLQQKMAAKGEEEYYDCESEFLHDALLTLVSCQYNNVG